MSFSTDPTTKFNVDMKFEQFLNTKDVFLNIKKFPQKQELAGLLGYQLSKNEIWL